MENLACGRGFLLPVRCPCELALPRSTLPHPFHSAWILGDISPPRCGNRSTALLKSPLLENAIILGTWYLAEIPCCSLWALHAHTETAGAGHTGVSSSYQGSLILCISARCSQGLVDADTP